MQYNKEEVIRRLKEDFTYWYHRIDLGDGVVTPGFDYGPLWDNIRAVRDTIDYSGKLVLDIASFDGMWAFEAERAGAEIVVATDCLYRSFKNFLFCREVLSSKCVPYFNVSAYDLFERLNVFFEENYDDEKPYDRMFDVVQHLGLLYHLRDPFLSLAQARSCMKPGGTLLLETNVIAGREDSMMVYNGPPFTNRLSENYSVWWVPTVNCVKETLMASFFEPDEDSISLVTFEDPLAGRTHKLPKGTHGGKEEPTYSIQRMCLKAKALHPKEVETEFAREALRSFRNPGFQHMFLHD